MQAARAISQVEFSTYDEVLREMPLGAISEDLLKLIAMISLPILMSEPE